MATGTSDPTGKPKRGKRMTSSGISRKPGSIAKSDDVSPRNTPNSARTAQLSGLRPAAISTPSRCFAPDPGAQHDVFCDHDNEAIAGADFEGRLHLHVPARGFLAELPQLLAERSRNRLLGGEAAGLVVGVALAQL